MPDFNPFKARITSSQNKVRNESQKPGSLNNSLSDRDKKRKRKRKGNGEELRPLTASELAMDPRLVALRLRASNGNR